jgi:hypothetical protein
MGVCGVEGETGEGGFKIYNKKLKVHKACMKYVYIQQGVNMV